MTRRSAHSLVRASYRRLAPPRWAYLVAITVAAHTASPVAAVTLEWINAAGGDAGVASNWSPSQLPAQDDRLEFRLPDAYGVSFDASIPPIEQVQLFEGDVTFDFSPAQNTFDGYVLIGTDPGDDAALTINSGSPRFLGRLFLGSDGGSGSLTIDGAHPSWAGWNGFLHMGNEGGDGVFTIENGGSAVFGGNFVVGWDGTGAVFLQGRGTTPPYQRSTLTIEPTSNGLIVGDQQGSGEIDVLDGALLDVDAYLVMGTNPGSYGALVVAGAPGDSAIAYVGRDLLIGANAIALYAAGGGTVILESEALLDVAQSTWTYDEDGSEGGVLDVRDGRFETFDLYLEHGDDLLIGDGEVWVTGGVLDMHPSNGVPLEIDGAGTDQARLYLSDGAVGHLHSTSGPALRVANGGQGHLTLRGSELFVHDFNTVVGDAPGSEGIITIEDGSTLTVDELLILGREGYGALNVNSGSTAWTNDVRAATQTGGIGGMIIDDGGTVHVAGRLELGGTSAGPAGALGSALVLGDLWLDRAGDSGDVWDNSAISLWDGTLHLTGGLNVEGSIDVVDGSSTGGRLDLAGSGRIEGRGDLASRIASDDATTEIVATGALLLGRSNAENGFDVRGRLDVGAHEVTIRDADSAMVADVTLGGGTLHLPNTPAVLRNGHLLSGHGTIEGALRLRGAAIAQAGGLAFGGNVFGVGEGMTGSTFRFLSGSKFTGEGAIEADVHVEEGATMRTTGVLELGEITHSTVTIDGLLDVGQDIVALHIADTTRVNGVVEIDGGVLSIGVFPTLIESDGMLRGNGETGGRLQVEGTLSPGPGAGHLDNFALWLEPSARIQIDLGDHSAGEWDTVSTDWLGQLDGTLELRTLPSFTGAAGDTFRVIAGLNLTGGFTDVTVNGGPAAGVVEVLQTSTAVYVVMLGDVTPVEAQNEIPAALPARNTLAQNAPNPFNPTTSIGYALAREGNVSLRIFDANGRMVRELIDATQTPARYEVIWDGRDGSGRQLASGIYFYRLDAPGFREVRRMVMMK